MEDVKRPDTEFRGSRRAAGAAVARALEGVVPAERLSWDDSDLLAHTLDSWPLGKKVPLERVRSLMPLVVVRPASPSEVAAVLKVASQLRVPVIPYGGGSGVVGSAMASQTAISLDTTALNGVVHFSAQDRLVAVRAGHRAADLEEYLKVRGFRLPHYPQSLSLATVGGLVATRSSGTFSTKYGSIEHLLVGLEVALASGSLVRWPARPRSTAGPDLVGLFVGSEGTLGIITEVTLRVTPVPEATRYRTVSFDDLKRAIWALHRLLGDGVRPAVVRLYDEVESEELLDRADGAANGKCILVLAFDGPAAVVEAELTATLDLLARWGGVDLGAQVAEQWARTRYDARWFHDGNATPTQMADAIEVSGLWSQLLKLHSGLVNVLSPFCQRVYGHFSHFYGQGACLYMIFEVQRSSPQDAVAAYMEAWGQAMELVLSEGGSILHHHGLGLARAPWLARELSESLGVLDSVRAALDPGRVLNPGKLVETDAGWPLTGRS